MKCKICNNLNLHLFKDNNKSYYLCKTCECIFLDDLYILNETEEKKRYSTHNNSLQNKGYVSILSNFIDESVFPFFKPNKNLLSLDYGCGPNPVLSILLNKYYSSFYYDPYFFNDINYLNNNYNIITSTEVFEHIKDPVISLIHLKNILSNQGIISIMTKFHPNNIYDFTNWYYKRDPTHIIFYTIKTFKVISHIINLKIIYNNQDNIIVFKK